MMDLSNSGKWKLTLSQDFLILAIIAGTFGMGLFSLAGWKTKERVVQTVKEPSVLDGFKVLFKNKPLMLIIISNLIGTLGGLAGVFQTYYYSGSQSQFSSNLDKPSGNDFRLPYISSYSKA